MDSGYTYGVGSGMDAGTDMFGLAVWLGPGTAD